MPITANSFTVLKSARLELTRPMSIGLVSCAPKKVTPTIVVNQSEIPISSRAEKNRRSFFIMDGHQFLFTIHNSETPTYPFTMLKYRTDIRLYYGVNIFN